MSTLLITGSTGKVADSLIRSPLFQETNIIAVSRKSGNLGITRENLKSLSYEEALQNSHSWNIDTVVLAGSITGIKEMSNNPIQNIFENIKCSVRFIQQLTNRGVNIRKVIHLGSVTQYGAQKLESVSEDHCLNPMTYYDQSKTIIESLLNQVFYDGSIGQLWNLRLSNIFGFSFDNNPQRGFFDSCIRRLMEGKQVQIFGDGQYIRDYLHFEDLLKLLKNLHEREPRATSESLNVASGNAVTIRQAVSEIANIIFERYGRESVINYVPFPAETAAIDYRSFGISTHKSFDTYGWRADVSLRTGIEKSFSRDFNQ